MSISSDYLAHYGIKGQKWGIRRFENYDGSLTAAGKERYLKKVDKMAKKDAQRLSDAEAMYGDDAGTRRKIIKTEIQEKKKNDKEYEKRFDDYYKKVDREKSRRRAEKLHANQGRYNRGMYLQSKGFSNAKGILKASGEIALTALAGYYVYSSVTAKGSSVVRAMSKDSFLIPVLALGISAGTDAARNVSDTVSYNYYKKNHTL